MKNRLLLLLFLLVFTASKAQDTRNKDIFTGAWYTKALSVKTLVDHEKSDFDSYFKEELKKFDCFEGYYFMENGILQTIAPQSPCNTPKEGKKWGLAGDTLKMSFDSSFGNFSMDFTYNPRNDSVLFLEYTDSKKLFVCGMLMTRKPCQK